MLGFVFCRYILNLQFKVILIAFWSPDLLDPHAARHLWAIWRDSQCWPPQK